MSYDQYTRALVPVLKQLGVNELGLTCIIASYASISDAHLEILLAAHNYRDRGYDVECYDVWSNFDEVHCKVRLLEAQIQETAKNQLREAQILVGTAVMDQLLRLFVGAKR